MQACHAFYCLLNNMGAWDQVHVQQVYVLLLVPAGLNGLNGLTGFIFDRFL